MINFNVHSFYINRRRRMRLKKYFINGITKAVIMSTLVMFGMWIAAPAQALVAAKAPDVSMKDAKYVGSETCASCHEDKVRNFKLSPHARISPAKAEDGVQGCETCHGPGSLHVDAGGGKGVFITNPKKDPSTCFACHMEKKMEFRLPNHHPVLEGKMSCTDCHDLHGADAMAHATTMETQNDTCFKCHKDQQGPFVYEHAALKDGCTTCHKVHGSINEKMLIARDANLCLRCHADVMFPSAIGAEGDHTSRIQNGACWTGGCHIALHGSNFAPDLRY